MTTTMLQIGDQFDRFQIQGLLAHGGMSDIYHAYDVVNRCEVALKIPDRSMIGDPAQFERFQREKEVLSTLQHPAILRGLGTGTYNRIPYLAMELIDGQSLRDYITQYAPLPVETVLPIFLKIADGMAYCHEHDVIHRDLKPENIILKTGGAPIIMDFGLALTKGAHRVTYSNLTATMGTPEYMAPEQVEGKRGDERTDVYALATILFEMLAGNPPFSGDNNLVVMSQRLQMPAPRLDQVKPGTSLQIAAIIARALQRDPDRRYPDIRAFIADLENPQQADLSALESSGPTTTNSWWQSSYVKAVGIAFVILVSLIGLAVLLQNLR
jgi:eukaryotic-like serine/threonine-protein kinase